MGHRKADTMSQTTLNSAKGWSPDVSAFAPQDVIPDALILQTSTVAGSIEGDEPAVRVVHVNDDEAEFVAEGAEIPLGDPELDETLVYTGKVAQLLKISREQYNTGSAASLLSTSVARAVTNRANQAYVAQAAPTGGNTTPPAGLLNVTGIGTGDPIATDLDPLADAVATIEAAGGTPTHILAAPDAWAALRKLRTGDGSNVSLLGAGTEDADKRVLGIPVLTTPAMPAGRLLMLDRSAVVSAVGTVQVATSTDVYFGSDSVGLRCVWRFGQNVVRPDRIVQLTVNTEGS